MADEAPTTETPAERPAAEPPAAEATTPPWERDGEQFDPERAWARIQAQKADLDAIRAERDSFKTKVAEFEDAQLTEAQRTERDLETLRTTNTDLATENAILKAVIANPSLTEADIELLQGVPADAVADRAAKLAARLGTGAPNPLATRPTEALRGGADPTAPRPGSSNDWLRDALAQSQH